MSRYSAMFGRLKAKREAAFGAFLMLGDPDPGRSARLLDAVVDAGADMVEVGIPFSDPVADGPAIQAAAQRAMAAGMRVGDCLELVRGFRARHADVPIGILTYANIAVARGLQRFCGDATRAGADSLLLADVPSLEAEPFSDAARSAGLDWVMIAATNTPRPALERIARLSSGYTYCVTRFGVTGASLELAFDHGALLEALRRGGAPPPVFGFGISNAEQVTNAVAAGARGVIAGSALVELARQPDAEQAIRNKVGELKAATRPDKATTRQD